MMELDGTGRTVTNPQSEVFHCIFPFVAYRYLLVARRTYRMQKHGTKRLGGVCCRYSLAVELAGQGISYMRLQGVFRIKAGDRLPRQGQHSDGQPGRCWWGFHEFSRGLKNGG